MGLGVNVGLGTVVVMVEDGPPGEVGGMTTVVGLGTMVGLGTVVGLGVGVGLGEAVTAVGLGMVVWLGVVVGLGTVVVMVDDGPPGEVGGTTTVVGLGVVVGLGTVVGLGVLVGLGAGVGEPWAHAAPTPPLIATTEPAATAITTRAIGFMANLLPYSMVVARQTTGHPVSRCPPHLKKG